MSEPTPGEIRHVQQQLVAANHDVAANLARRFIQKFPNHGYGYRALASALFAQGHNSLAKEAAGTALQLNPNDLYAHTLMGWLQLETGNLKSTETHFQNAVKLDPSYFEAHIGLARIHKFTANDPLLSLLEAKQSLFGNDHPHYLLLSISLAKAYKDIGDLEKFLDYTCLANKHQRELTSYQINDDFGLFHNVRLKDRDSPTITLKRPKAPSTPIFILGIPRSGTTLVEQIISQHPDIAHGGELAFLWQAYHQFCGLSNYALKACESTRRHYFRCTRALYAYSPYFTDKNPQNFLFVGLIKRALPEAKIIHVVSNPRDVCWSNYRTIFKTGLLQYSNNIDDTVSYYNQYADLMEYWYQRYPDDIYTLQYESLINDIESASRSLLSHIGLPWEPSCLEFHNNPNPVKTASQLQVRQGLKDMNDEWKSFEAFLAKPFEQLKIPGFWNPTQSYTGRD